MIYAATYKIFHMLLLAPSEAQIPNVLAVDFSTFYPLYIANKTKHFSLKCGHVIQVVKHLK